MHTSPPHAQEDGWQLGPRPSPLGSVTPLHPPSVLCWPDISTRPHKARRQSSKIWLLIPGRPPLQDPRTPPPSPVPTPQTPGPAPFLSSPRFPSAPPAPSGPNFPWRQSQRKRDSGTVLRRKRDNYFEGLQKPRVPGGVGTFVTRHRTTQARLHRRRWNIQEEVPKEQTPEPI